MKFSVGKLSELRYSQYLYAVAALSTLTPSGIHFSWTSPAIPQLTSMDSPIGVTLTSTETSLVASLLFVGMALGSTCASFPIEHLGRKKTLLISNVPTLIAGILILFAKSAAWLYAARVVIGAATALCLSVGPIYSAEIAENDIRGQISNLLTIMSMLGNLFGYCVGPFVSYNTFAISLTVIPIITFILCAFVPESPYYLVKKGKTEEARAAIKRLSSSAATNEFIDKRLTDITESVENDMQSKSTFLELFKPQYRKSLIVAVVVRFLMYSSGLYCVFSYLQTIMDLSGSPIPSSYASIIFGALNVVTSLLSGQLVDRIGRKPMFIVCTFMSAISLYAEGIYFYLYEATNYDVSSLSWLPLVALLIYEIFVIIGLLGLPFIIVGEIFPLNIKGVALSLNSFLGAPLGLIALITFQPMMEHWGTYTPFWVYAGCCTIGFFYGIFVLPETKGKTFAEIQKELN